MALLFLPGTIIHELSHAIMAKLLFVHVGRMELMPQLHGESLKLGSVEVGKTDIVRNFLIGIAPFVVGTILILFILHYAFSSELIGLNLITALILLFTFIVANTMYSSKKDMEGALEFFLLVVAPILTLYFLGVRIPGLSWNLLQTVKVEDFFRMANLFMSVPIVIDIAIIIFARIIRK